MTALKFALRQLQKNPGFTAVAVLTLALGIGANTAIFTTLYSLVWRPLPVKDPTTVVNLHQSFDGPSARQALGGINRLSYPEYLNYRDRTRTLSGLLGFEDANFTLGDTKTSRVSGILATGNYFDVLGASPELGRVWSANECDVPGACPVVVLSHGFWQRQFGADPGIVGRTVTLNHQAMTVIGVLPSEFRGTELKAPEVWVPLLMHDQLFTDEPGRLDAKDFSWLQVVGRLKTGVSIAAARQELNVIALQSDADSSITGWPARKSQVQVKTGAYFNSPEDIKQGLPVALVVLFIFALPLVVVCANVSNLVLARASVRRREIGIRLSLGAGRARLIGQLLIESFLLAGIAGGLGLTVAFLAPRLMLNLLPPDALGVLDFTPNLAILGYCTAVSIFAAACVGLAPAFHATRLELTSLLSTQAAPLGKRIAGVRLRNVMVVTQVAVSVLLLVCAGLLVRGVHRALSTDLGFERKNLFVLSVDREASGYNAAQTRQFRVNLTERLAGFAGVKATSLANLAPFMGNSTTTVRLEPANASAPGELANFNVVSPSYFETLGVGLLEGRGFNRMDEQNNTHIAIVNEAMARRFWPGANPVGQHFYGLSTEPQEVVGVVRDFCTTMPGVMDGPFFYLPTSIENDAANTVLVRTDGAHAVTGNVLQDLIKSIDANASVRIRTIDQNINQRTTPMKLASILSSILGLLALGLVAIGVYGVLAYVVSQRTREIGVRIALGAESRMIQRQMVGEGLRVIMVGVGIGILLAALGSQVLRNAIFGLGTLDPITFLSVTLLLLAASALACWLPARRAAKVDPMEALRNE